MCLSGYELCDGRHLCGDDVCGTREYCACVKHMSEFQFNSHKNTCRECMHNVLCSRQKEPV